MPLPDSLYGIQGVEHPQDSHFNVAPEFIPAPEDNLALPVPHAPNETTLQPVNVDEIGNTSTAGTQGISDHAVEQIVNSTSVYGVNTEETAALQDVGQLVISVVSAFSAPLDDDATISSSEVSSPQLTAYKPDSIGVHSMPRHTVASAPGRAEGRILAALLSVARALRRALRRVIRSTKQVDARSE